MKVQAHFPTACRDEQAVHAPAEPHERAEGPSRPKRPERSSGWRASGAAHGFTLPAVDHERSLSGVPMRRGRAFPTTRPHAGGSSREHGIGP